VELARLPKAGVLLTFLLPVVYAEATCFVCSELTSMKVLIVPNYTSAKIHMIRKVSLLNGETLFDKLDAFAKRCFLLIEANLAII
jgi:hypothetical protein